MKTQAAQPTLKISIKQQPIGKPTTPNGKQLTYGWQNVALSPAQLTDHICSGKPFAVAQYKNGHRAKKNFIASNFIASDIDSGAEPAGLSSAELSALLQDPFLLKNACFVIESFNSQAEAYRLRVGFALSEIITNAEEYRALVKLVQGKLRFADPAAKDAARAFYGGKPGRAPLWTDFSNILDVGTLRAEAAAARASKPATDYVRSLRTIIPDLGTIREALHHIPAQLAYQDWLAVLMAIHSAFPGADGVALAESWSPGKPGEIEYKFKTFEGGHVTLGTLFYLAQQYGYQPPQQTTRPAPRTSSRKQNEGRSTPPPQADQAAGVKLEARYLTNADLDLSSDGVHAIKSAVGTGKTELIKRIISEQPPEASILVVTHRITLARELSERFNFENYQSIPASYMGMVPRLVITPNSLHKVLGKLAKLPSYHLIILDEAEQVLEHIAGSTFRGAQGVQALKLLSELVKRAPKVIAADAELTRLTIDWLERHRSDVTRIVNTYQPREKLPMQLLSDENHWISELLKRLENASLPVVICTDSKRKAKDFDKLLGSLGYYGKCVHSDSRDTAENRTFLFNIDKLLPQLDYFVYSPTIDAGIDIQTEVEAVFGFFLNRTAAPTSQLQMLGRCRQAQQFVVYSALTTQQLITSAAVIKQQVILNNLENARHGGFGIEWDAEGNAVLDPDRDAYLTLQARVQAKHNRLMVFPRAAFKDLARQRYKLIISKAPKDLPDYTEQLKAARAARREEEKQLILTSPPVDDETLNLAQLRGQLTPELVFGNVRRTYERFYGQPISENLIAEAQNRAYGGMMRLERFILLHQDRDYLRALDREEIEQNTADSLRKLNTVRIERIKEGLAIVFGEQLHTERIPIDEFTTRLASFNDFFEEKELGRLLGRRTNSSDTPLKRFRWLLSLVGLRLKLWRGRNGKREYSLDADRYQSQIVLANLRINHSPQIREQHKRLGLTAKPVTVGLELRCNATVQENNKAKLHSRVTKSSSSTGKSQDTPPEPFQKPPPT